MIENYIKGEYRDIFEDVGNIVLIRTSDHDFLIFDRKLQSYHLVEYGHSSVIKELRKRNVLIVDSVEEVIDTSIKVPLLKWDEETQSWLDWYPV